MKKINRIPERTNRRMIRIANQILDELPKDGFESFMVITLIYLHMKREAERNLKCPIITTLTDHNEVIIREDR